MDYKKFLVESAKILLENKSQFERDYDTVQKLFRLYGKDTYVLNTYWNKYLQGVQKNDPKLKDNYGPKLELLFKLVLAEQDDAKIEQMIDLFNELKFNELKSFIKK